MAEKKPPIPVHALDDKRTHLSPPHHGRLLQGRLKTLCGKLAVSELPLFTMAETKGRCPRCFAAMEQGTPQAARKEVETSEAKKPPRPKARPPAKQTAKRLRSGD